MKIDQGIQILPLNKDQPFFVFSILNVSSIPKKAHSRKVPPFWCAASHIVAYFIPTFYIKPMKSGR